MKLTYCKELIRYTENELKIIFNITEKLTVNKNFIELKSKKIITLKDEGMYSIEFVGILILNDVVLICLPKYIHDSDEKTVAKQLLALFQEYSKREKLDQEEIESIGNIDDSNEYNMLSIIIFLVNDYFENGLYSNEKSIFLFNGEDEINWLKTIDEVEPILNDGEPVYLEYFTHSTQNDEENYFRQLHRYILTECTNRLNNLGLSEFFGFEPIFFDVDEESLGSPQGVLSRIENELNVQFVNRKQLLLKAISSFISREKMETDNFLISFYGTRSFHTVWEKTCAYILNNKYDFLKNFIAKPRWKTVTGKVHEAKTLVPDIISVHKRNLKKYLIISDAKYYSIKLADAQLSGNPGIEDITKQYLYQLAYEDYIKSHKFDIVKNMLLFPSEEDEIQQIGTVTIDFLKKLNLEDIILIKMPAYYVFTMYIKSKKLDIGSLIKF